MIQALHRCIQIPVGWRVHAWWRAWLLVVLICVCGGCELVGFAAYVIGGKQGDKVTVEAAYDGLDNRSVAVLVSADEYTFFEYADATAAVGREVSAQLAAHIPGVKVVNPKQIARFQIENPYWNTLPYGDLMRRLGVDRLLYIDLIQYSLHEAGNAYVQRGVVMANIAVAEADASQPHNSAYTVTLQARYPDATPVGLLEGDRETIKLGMLRSFSMQLIHLFKEHEVVKQ